MNLAVLVPTALIPPPAPHSSWALLATYHGLIATQEMSTTALRFTAEQFDLQQES